MLFVNCGSIGKPKNGDPRGAFSLLDAAPADLHVTIERVEYDAAAVAREVAVLVADAATNYGIRCARTSGCVQRRVQSASNPR